MTRATFCERGHRGHQIFPVSNKYCNQGALQAMITNDTGWLWVIPDSCFRRPPGTGRPQKVHSIHFFHGLFAGRHPAPIMGHELRVHNRSHTVKVRIKGYLSAIILPLTSGTPSGFSLGHSRMPGILCSETPSYLTKESSQLLINNSRFILRFGQREMQHVHQGSLLSMGLYFPVNQYDC